MFDDCKGEKFIELLAVFSTLVLRKVVGSRAEGKGSIARHLCLEKKLSVNEQQSFLPLAVAHRGALKTVLERRTMLRSRYRDFGHTLDMKDREVRLFCISTIVRFKIGVNGGEKQEYPITVSVSGRHTGPTTLEIRSSLD